MVINGKPSNFFKPFDNSRSVVWIWMIGFCKKSAPLLNFEMESIWMNYDIWEHWEACGGLLCPIDF